MSYIYNNLSSGYVGQYYEESTLNAKYYCLLFHAINQSPTTFNHIVAFPQRIPKRGFFEELYELETDQYRKKFDSIVGKIIAAYNSSLEKITQNNSEFNIRQYINWSNVLLRYGKCDYVINSFSRYNVDQGNLEVLLLKETAKIELLLSEGKPFLIDTLLALSNQFIDNNNIDDRDKIKLLNQIVVNFYRYQKKYTEQSKILFLSKLLLKFVKRHECESKAFLNSYLCSIAYRGLAMVSDFDTEIRTSFLHKSLELAINIEPKTEMDKIVSQDNLFTCKQSLAKWSLQNNNLKEAESYLQELTLIDPNDSTGFSELGFFYINRESYDQAIECFKQAMALGPPGMGMNTYYYAKCLEKLGKKQNVIAYLHQAAMFDKQAISPWLDLLNIYETAQNEEKMHEVASYICRDSTLREQLEENELVFIQNILN